MLTLPQDELDVLKNASLRIVATHDIQTTISTFESLYRGEPVADPVTAAAPSVPAPE